MENRESHCVATLDCILNVVRALRMGSCLSDESRSPRAGSPMGIRKKKSLKKRYGSQGSLDYRREERLYRTPGRMFLNGSSEIASIYTQQGKKGTNQDAMIVWENFGSRTDTVFCGVFDGHGPYGHMVAKRVRDSLPLKLSSHWEVNSIKSDDVLREVSLNSMPAVSFCSEGTSFVSADEEASRGSTIDEDSGKQQPEAFETLKESFLKAFKFMDRELKMHANIDCFCSGTTAVTLVKQGKDLVLGNVGDSRAVLATRDEKNLLTAVQLTVDLKPNLPAEAERIHKCKGRVFSLPDEPGVSRVWLPHNNSPGLAMARAFGDFCLKDFGLISVPEISYRRITDKDEFIVLASDGIWDVLSNKEVVDIVGSCSTRSHASRALVETAVKAWKMKYPTSKVDDCAVVCLFLDSNESNSLTTDSKDNIPSIEEGDGEDTANPKEEVMVEGTANPKEEFSEALVSHGFSDDEKVKNTEVGQNWSALEGVSRVNTLVNLPRFTPGKEDEKAAVENKARK